MNQFHPYWMLTAAFLIALLPLLVGVCTSYLKISIVLTMLRSGLGTQQTPGGLIVMTLSLALTALVMAPVIQETAAEAEKIEFAWLSEKPDAARMSSLVPLVSPLRRFMADHSGIRELAVLSELSGTPPPEPPYSADLRVLMPAFVLSELKEGFAMGFVLLLPFLVVDLIVANILAGLGMYMVSPVMISLPLKLLLFVLCDGWLLLGKGLIASYRL